MQTDGAALYAATMELKQQLLGGRIERIAQPTRNDVVLVVRSNGVNHRLFISADPENARLHLGAPSTEKGPDKPFPFLMLLRKHIAHGRIEDIRIADMDRVVTFEIQSTNEMGLRVRLSFIAEIMGKHSNLILTDEEGIILDSAKRIPPSVSSLRTILPGTRYEQPPTQNKANPLTLSAEDFYQKLSAYGGSLEKALTGALAGVSPFLARQICAQAQNTEQAAQICSQLFSALRAGELAPCLVYDHNDALYGFSPFCPVGYRSVPCNSMNDALLQYFNQKQEAAAIAQLRTALRAPVLSRLGKLEKRLAIQTESLLQAKDMEQVRLEGELITAYAYQMKKGDASATVYDYTADRELVITLDTTLTPHENAAKRYKRFTKLKATAQAASQQIEKIREEMDYLTGVQVTIDQAETMEDLAEIRDELRMQNILPAPQVKGKRAVVQESRPIRFVSSDGVEMFAGRNNVQNDMLTTRLARSTDTWLHVQGMPGSHVVVRVNPIPHKTLLEAAQIAAFFSRARNSENVPVDYTLVKNVHKPSGSKPGFVTYVSQKTLFVTPDGDYVKSLIREG